MEFDNLDETINRVKGAEVVMPKRKTFYGSTEIGIKNPAGHYLTLRNLPRSHSPEFGEAKERAAKSMPALVQISDGVTDLLTWVRGARSPCDGSA